MPSAPNRKPTTKPTPARASKPLKPPTSKPALTSSEASITSTSSSSPSPHSQTSGKKIRHTSVPHASLYAAVAGRLTSRSVSLIAPSTQRRATPLKDALWLSRRPMRPADALFKHKGAPERYMEIDVYDAASGLPPGARGEEVLKRGQEVRSGSGRSVVWQDIESSGPGEEVERKHLPESDMLKAIHAYASDFYGALGLAARRGGKRKKKDVEAEMKASFGSMDETALLAFGVLMEESVRGALGETGDLAFVEGMQEEIKDGGNGVRASVALGDGEMVEEGEEMQEVRSKKGKRVRIQEDVEVQEEDDSQGARRKKRRRRLDYGDDEDY